MLDSYIENKRKKVATWTLTWIIYIDSFMCFDLTFPHITLYVLWDHLFLVMLSQHSVSHSFRHIESRFPFSPLMVCTTRMNTPHPWKSSLIRLKSGNTSWTLRSPSENFYDKNFNMAFSQEIFITVQYCNGRYNQPNGWHYNKVSLVSPAVGGQKSIFKATWCPDIIVMMYVAS